MILFNLENDFVLLRFGNSLVRIAAIELTFKREDENLCATNMMMVIPLYYHSSSCVCAKGPNSP
jgi:hypothetical protein